MADPVTWAVVGAGAGAMMDKEDPLRGAALGAIGGGFGGPMLGSAIGGTAAANSAAAGLSSLGAEQAAMLAAQTGEFGLPGLMSLNSSAGYAAGANGLAAGGGLFGRTAGFLGEPVVGGMSRGDLLGAAGKVSGIGQQPQPQNAVVSNPMAMMGSQNAPPIAQASPYAANAEMLERQMAQIGRPYNNLARLPRV